MSKLLRRTFLIVAGLAVLAAIVYAFLPQPVAVDVAVVATGSLSVTVNEDGKTRIKERYVVSMPLAGQLRRIELEPGDPVTAGSTLLATIMPTNPDLLDPRAQAEAEARVSAAQATVDRAQAAIDAAQAAREIAESQYERVRRLEESRAAAPQLLEDALLEMRLRQEEHRSAEFSLEIARFELEQAQAALRRYAAPDEALPAEWQFEIVSPIDGQVLRVLQESAAVLQPGTPLLELGDPTNLELEIDVLSIDAVRIQRGDSVLVEHWGGDEPLRGTVRVIEPAAFTKISALGVEEQRVNIIADLDAPSDARSTLGDGFRFEARVVVWQGDDVLVVPTSALFRQGDDWAVFVIQDDTARLRTITIGHRNAEQAEVQEGLTSGDRVIIYPSDRIQDGVSVIAR